MSRVYVVQKQMRWDEKRQELVPKFPDIHRAEEFGDLEYLLSPKAAPWNAPSIMRDLHHKLRHYTSEDYLLLIGNPCLIGWTVAVASQYSGGKVNLLQWSGQHRKYIAVSGNVNNEE